MSVFENKKGVLGGETASLILLKAFTLGGCRFSSYTTKELLKGGLCLNFNSFGF